MYIYNYALLCRHIRLTSFLIFFALIGLSSTFATNYYVDRNASGNGSGSSWANASLWSSFNWSQLNPGDTVFVNGGTDSLVYSSNLRMNINASGSSQNKIVITRGKEPGHNGKPIFRLWNRYCVYVNGKSNLELSYLRFENLGDTAYIALCFDNFSNNIDVLHNEIYHPKQKGTAFIRSSGRYMYNVDSTGAVNTPEETDCLDIYWTGNIEVAHNQFSINNSNPNGHNDVIQSSNLFGDIGINKVYDNFAIQNQSGGIFYFGSCQGYWRVYNNILVGKAGSGNSVLEFNNAGDPSKPIYARVYNNTLVSVGGMYPIMADNCDSLDIKNNLIYKPGGDDAINLYGSTTNGYVSIDYNRYYLRYTGNYQGRINGTEYSWQGWQSLGYEANGSTGAVNLLNPSGSNVNDYASNLLDNGTDLSSYFSKDILLTNRPQGSSWDIGALEKIQGGSGNNPPLQPSNPQPLNAAIDQSVDVNLSWSCSDPEGDPLTYDVYFGTSSNPPLVNSAQTNTSYDPGQLADNTTYYWKIKAKDDHSNSTTGAIWHFTTAAGFVNTPPVQPSNPNPVNGAQNQDTTLTISWNCSDPDGDTLSYDIYFGTNSNPPLVSTNQTQKNYNPGILNQGTTYYWKITAKDNHNASVTSPIWNFATLTQGTNTVTTIELKALLEGPYTNNAMATDLNANNLIPQNQPYNQPPWSYNGNEVVNQMPSNAVDWVLLELRNTPSNVIARRAALMLSDGRITDLDGSQRVSFPGVPGGQYYVVVRHRNHLAIMTKSPIQLSDSTALYDFTSSEDKAYGSMPMKDLGNGKFGLYAADGNGNGSVNNADNNSVWKKDNGTMGYEPGDFDMNGGVTIVDKNSKWKPNNGKSSQVP